MINVGVVVGQLGIVLWGVTQRGIHYKFVISVVLYSDGAVTMIQLSWEKTGRVGRGFRV